MRHTLHLPTDKHLCPGFRGALEDQQQLVPAGLDGLGRFHLSMLVPAFAETSLFSVCLPLSCACRLAAFVTAYWILNFLPTLALCAPGAHTAESVVTPGAGQGSRRSGGDRCRPEARSAQAAPSAPEAR